MSDRIARMNAAVCELAGKLPLVCPFPHVRCRLHDEQAAAALITTVAVAWDWKPGEIEASSVGVPMRTGIDCQCAMMAAVQWLHVLLAGGATDDKLACEAIEDMLRLSVGPGRIARMHVAAPRRPHWLPLELLT